METFADAAFAFAVTLLVIAGGDIPGSFEGLLSSVREIPSFAVSFVLIMMFWYGHLQWSRRFGLEDLVSVVLTGLLIFVILVYVIPLKLVSSAMIAFFTGNRLGTGIELQARHQLTQLFVLYGIGYVAMCATLAALNGHGLRRRSRLALNEYEVFVTRVTIWQWILLGAPGLVSALWAGLAPVEMGVWAGFAYMVLPVVMPVFGTRVARRARTRFGEML